MKRRFLTVLCSLSLSLTPLAFGQNAGTDDPVLSAMKAELARSKSQLKIEGMPAPYYIDYRITDIDGYDAEAAFGSVRSEVRTRIRFVRVVVRVGDYKQDSFYAQGTGSIELLTLDNDEQAIRHQLWLATDKAYKDATEALTAKQTMLKQFTVEQDVDDFAHAEPVVSIGPLAKLQYDRTPLVHMLKEASGLYRNYPDLQLCDTTLRFQAINRYFLTSEGTAVRSGQSVYQMLVNGSAQAADGMRLDRNNGYTVADARELPSEKEFVAYAGKLFDSLKQLREAPLMEEEYRGPVLFGPDAAADIFADFIGENVLGMKPQLGQPARTRGQFATSYKNRVLPEFLSVTDDPTVQMLAGKLLMGYYTVDDEGVKAAKVGVIENGKLENYLTSREPIRDFPTSNGHGRARLPINPPGPSLGNLIVSSSEPVSAAQLKQKLIELCKQHDLPYGYYAQTLGQGRSPRMLTRIWVKDGHEELVRGAQFGDLDTRSLRSDLIAAGDDVYVQNRPTNIPHSIVSPSVLFDELELKRANRNNEKLPEYPAPTPQKTTALAR